jgi:hypothetical protein
MIKNGIRPTLAEVGKIKTGFKGEMVKSKSGTSFQPPKKLDYFIITTTVRDKDSGNLIQDSELMKKLSADSEGKIREIAIRLPFDSIDKNFFTQYQAYAGHHCICRGDGEKASQLDQKTGERKEIICNPEKCPLYSGDKPCCKVSGILSAFIPQSGVFGGVYRLRTHSYNAVSSILGSLQYIAENTGGILQGIPLKLVLIKKTTEDHGDVMYPTVVLDVQEMQGLRTLAIAEKQNRIAIGFDMHRVEEEATQSGFFSDTDTEEDVAEEYYPETEQAEPEKKSASPEDLAEQATKAAAEQKKAEPVKQESQGNNHTGKIAESSTGTAQKPAEPEKKMTVGKPVPPAAADPQFDIF